VSSEIEDTALCSTLQLTVFVCSKRDIAWNVMFKRLQEFKYATGHCNVPQGFTADLGKLGKTFTAISQHKSKLIITFSLF